MDNSTAQTMVNRIGPMDLVLDAADALAADANCADADAESPIPI